MWAGFALLLFVSTWKLWTPQTEFPQIPFFEFLIDVPGWVDWIALALLGLSLTVCLFVKPRSMVVAGLWLFAISVSVLILLNQHRLQPWAYQFLVFSIIMATARPRTAFAWMRWIAISIYLFSAISKFDYQFIHTVGDQMLWSLAGKIGLDSNAWSDQIRNGIVFCFPMAELLIGLALIIPRFRRFGLLAAVMMHLTLLAALVGHVNGFSVLIWNLFFIGQAVFLFGWSVEPETSETKIAKDEAQAVRRKKPSYPLEFMATIASVFVMLFPLSQPLGICDHWPAWQVYAPRSSRANIKSLTETDGVWTDLSAWSSVLQTPVYPQARFQLAVLIAAQEKFAKASGRPIDVSGESDRWTGTRETDSLTGDQVKMLVERFWLNTKPRRIWNDKASDL